MAQPDKSKSWQDWTALREAVAFYIRRLLGMRVEHDAWILERVFPLGQVDRDAVTEAVLSLLEKGTDRDTAERIAVDLAVQVWSWDRRFDESVLRTVLFLNGLHTISEQRVSGILDYAMLLNEARHHRKYPSEMIRRGDGWLHPKYSGLIRPR
jgi:hypothetical protein